MDPAQRQQTYQPLLDAYVNWMRHYQARLGGLQVERLKSAAIRSLSFFNGLAQKLPQKAC